MICTVEEFLKIKPYAFAATSGGFDPIHKGHIKCLIDTVNLGLPVVVIVNDNDFLLKKKGFYFMDLEERMFIVNSICGVKYVIPWHSEDGTVIECLRTIKPFVFTKGGDRTAKENIPEWNICKRIGCKIITGVGGDKEQSSSELVKRIKNG